MDDNSDGCENIVSTKQAISKFWRTFYTLAYSGTCQRSEPVKSTVLDV